MSQNIVSPRFFIMYSEDILGDSSPQYCTLKVLSHEIDFKKFDKNLQN